MAVLAASIVGYSYRDKLKEYLTSSSPQTQQQMQSFNAKDLYNKLYPVAKTNPGKPDLETMLLLEQMIKAINFEMSAYEPFNVVVELYEDEILIEYTSKEHNRKARFTISPRGVIFEEVWGGKTGLAVTRIYDKF